jgi:very-short-patch-repair endonuclease
MLQYNKSLKEYSRKLRKNMTDVENLLWGKIRNKQLKGYHFTDKRLLAIISLIFIVQKQSPQPPFLLKGGEGGIRT